VIELNNHVHGRIIAAGNPYTEGLDACISRSRGGKFLGGFILQRYNFRSVEAHVSSAAPFWCSRDLLWVFFDYIFNTMCVEKVVGIIPSTNEPSVNFATKVGFAEETRIKDMVPGGDYIVFSMYRAQCRWLNIEPRSIAPTLPEVFR